MKLKCIISIKYSMYKIKKAVNAIHSSFAEVTKKFLYIMEKTFGVIF